MAQYIKQGNLFGRVGTGIGQGLSEQLPKEIERGRLASGLQNLEDKKGLSPFQQFSRLASIPGITPQMIQSGSELLRQQGMAEGFKSQGGGKDSQSPFFQTPMQQEANLKSEKPPSITTPQNVKATIENYIPKSREQIVSRGGELYNSQRQLYPTPQDAINAAIQEDQQNQSINKAQQEGRRLQQEVQTGTENKLKGEVSRLGLQLPGNILSDLENEAIDLVKSGKNTEEEAGKIVGRKAREIEKEYNNLRTVGGIGVVSKPSKNTLSQLENLRKDFKKRGDLNNFIDTLVTNGNSNEFAHAFGKPVNENKEAANVLKSLPSIKPKLKVTPGTAGGLATQGTNIAEREQKTLQASEKLANSLKSDKNLSPLAISYELEKKGYDPQVWTDYVTRNRDRLNLSQDQINELGRSPNTFWSKLNDWWLQAFTGLEE